LGLHTCLRKKPLFKKFQIDFMPGAGKETQYNISHSPQNTFCSKRKKKKRSNGRLQNVLASFSRSDK